MKTSKLLTPIVGNAYNDAIFGEVIILRSDCQCFDVLTLDSRNHFNIVRSMSTRNASIRLTPIKRANLSQKLIGDYHSIEITQTPQEGDLLVFDYCMGLVTKSHRIIFFNEDTFELKGHNGFISAPNDYAYKLFYRFVGKERETMLKNGFKTCHMSDSIIRNMNEDMREHYLSMCERLNIVKSPRLIKELLEHYIIKYYEKLLEDKKKERKVHFSIWFRVKRMFRRKRIVWTK